MSCRDDPDAAKAYFRRGLAQAALAEYDAAREDFEAARRLDPSAGGDVDRELAKMVAQARKAAAKQRQEMKSFLDRGKG